MPHVVGSRKAHLWYLDLDAGPPVPVPFSSILSISERERADRFRRDLDRRRFAAARGMLRILLGQQLGRPPGEVLITEGDNGKPRLDDQTPLRSPLHFNVSHASGKALVCMTDKGRVGADIERIRPLSGMDSLAQRVLAPREMDHFTGLSEFDRPSFFFRVWTRKEALLKGTGEGLTREPREVEVGPAPDHRSGLAGRRIVYRHGAMWLLADLQMDSGWAGAIALEMRALEAIPIVVHPAPGFDLETPCGEAATAPDSEGVAPPPRSEASVVQF